MKRLSLRHLLQAVPDALLFFVGDAWWCGACSGGGGLPYDERRHRRDCWREVLR